MAMSVDIRYIDNDTMIQVTVSMDGFVERGYVSSMHLVDTRIAQLKECIARKAERAVQPWDDPLS